MRTAKAMQNRKLRYFSSLPDKAKERMMLDIKAMRKGLFSLPEGLRDSILSVQPLDDIFTEDKFIGNMLKGQKCFKHPKGWYPLNITHILKAKL